MTAETIQLIGFSEGDRFGINVGCHEIEFSHPRCSSTVVLTLAEFRRVDSVECPACGTVLGTFSEMVAWRDETLRDAASEKHRKLRAVRRREALRLHERLVSG